MFDTLLEYIHLNPGMAGLKINPEDWKYSSTWAFSGMKGLIEIQLTTMEQAGARKLY